MSNKQFVVPQASSPGSGGGGGGSGTVTSVGLADSTNTFTVTGSPVTTAGTLTLSAFANQTANTVLSGPTSGGAAPSSFRALVAADIPNLAASKITSGTLAVAQGGTNLASGTDGGILGFTAAGTIASSAALTANRIVVGGGAGATPTVLGSLGTTTTVLHGNAGGAPTFGAVVLTTDVSGVLPPANGGVANPTTADQGYFFGVQVFPNENSAVVNVPAAPSVQGVSVFQFVLPFAITVRHVTINVTALVNPSTVTVGIYSADGSTKLVDSGTFDSSTTGVKTNTITGVALPPGPYFYVMSASTQTTLTIVGSQNFGTFTPFLNSQTVKKVGNAANSATVGVLPASLGAITGATINYGLALFEP